MSVLGLDTATPATVVGVLRADGEAFEARHDPEPGERPGHATQLLSLVDSVLAASGVAPGEADRVAVGLGPGSFTGLRIGVATARGLAQGWGVELVGVSSLQALARGAPAAGTVAAVLDARRGEAFAAAWREGDEVLAPEALGPEELARALAALGGSPLAVGDGAVRFRAILEPAGATIPPDGDPAHRIAARQVCRLGAEGRATERDEVRPSYLRLPDAEVRRPKSP